MLIQEAVVSKKVITDISTDELFAIGELVPVSGLYVCVPCGYTKQFTAGELFPTCDACLAGTEYGPEGYQEEEVEFWSLIA